MCANMTAIVQGNTFQGNTYSGDATWAWNNDLQMDWNAWQSTGNDTNGAYNH